jgi:hypothetical protein
MATASNRSAPASEVHGAFAIPDFSGLLGPFVEAQRLQWKALLDWQDSVFTFNKDFWEQWACRYAGGVPIDG